ncbi:retrovirus-related Pol polyprotein from transposon 412 [Trichonephila clavata]|uniref:Retrovirus-related Pol polyprotein from transposon 412 n=1 Tax=Trichonephila clavata TaxID=2740835 RepID=A0A8X6HEK2_TRICU|nr:retrovirus-related Pol polyprotein from transposon 412 [Trichonephila clavata]
MAHGNAQWTTVLPTILMGFRATWKEDLQATTAEMIYGAPIRPPDEFLCPSKPNVDPVTFVCRPYRNSVPDFEAWKEVSVSIDKLKHAYIPKELEDILVEVNVKNKVSLQPEEVPDSAQEKPRESSSSQETTTRSGRRVHSNPKYG